LRKLAGNAAASALPVLDRRNTHPVSFARAGERSRLPRPSHIAAKRKGWRKPRLEP